MISNAELAQKLGTKPNLDQMQKKLADKGDIEIVKTAVHNSQVETRQLINRRMTDQSHNVVKAVTSAQQLGYNKGLGHQVELLGQVVNSLQKRVDTHNVNVNAVVRENQALNSDFKDAGARLSVNTKAINENLVPTMNKLLTAISRGIYHYSEPISEDVYKTLRKTTGQTVQDILRTEIYRDLRQSQSNAQKAAQYSKLYATTAKENANRLYAQMMDLQELIKELKHFGWIWLTEFVLVVGSFVLFPGRWKVIVTILLLLVLTGFNMWHQQEG